MIRKVEPMERAGWARPSINSLINHFCLTISQPRHIRRAIPLSVPESSVRKNRIQFDPICRKNNGGEELQVCDRWWRRLCCEFSFYPLLLFSSSSFGSCFNFAMFLKFHDLCECYSIRSLRICNDPLGAKRSNLCTAVVL